MQISWEDMIDDLRSWDDLELALDGPWREVRDRGSGLVLATQFDELLVDMPPSATPEQQRLLRELGFRRRDDSCWSWTPPPPTAGELRPSPAGLKPWLRAAWDEAQRELAIDRARSARAVHVLREVFAASPPDLEALVVIGDEDEDEVEEWDDDVSPDLDPCAILEARYGQPRRMAP